MKPVTLLMMEALNARMNLDAEKNDIWEIY